MWATDPLPISKGPYVSLILDTRCRSFVICRLAPEFSIHFFNPLFFLIFSRHQCAVRLGIRSLPARRVVSLPSLPVTPVVALRVLLSATEFVALTIEMVSLFTVIVIPFDRRMPVNKRLLHFRSWRKLWLNCKELRFFFHQHFNCLMILLERFLFSTLVMESLAERPRNIVRIQFFSWKFLPAVETRFSSIRMRSYNYATEPKTCMVSR